MHNNDEANKRAHVVNEVVENRLQIEVEILPGNRISRADAARVLRLRPRTLSAWEARGLLTPLKTGGRIFYDYGQVKAHIGAPTA